MNWSRPGTRSQPYFPEGPISSSEVALETSAHPFEAAEDGEAISYVGEPPSTGGSGETGPGLGDQWLALRTAEGWKTQGITPALGNPEYPAYQAFSPDLSNAIFMGGEIRSHQTSLPAAERSTLARRQLVNTGRCST